MGQSADCAVSPVQTSVITPVFNAERHLAVLLNSLSKQTERSLQIIVVDDGSTDASLAIARHAATLDSRILVASQPNRGVSAARNHGLALAQGQWIAFADSDDWLAPDALRTWRVQSEAQSLDVLVGNGFLFDDGTTEPAGEPSACNKLLHQQAWGEMMPGDDWIVRSIAGREWPHQVWLQFIRRDFLERTKLRFSEGVVHEDVLWTMHLGLAAQRIGFAETAFYGWRENPASITRNVGAGMSLHRAQSYLAVLKEIVDTAHRQSHRGVKRALLRHTNHQATHIVGLMRRRIGDHAVREQIARAYLDLGLVGAAFQGCANAADLWRALRCSWAISRFAKSHASKP